MEKEEKIANLAQLMFLKLKKANFIEVRTMINKLLSIEESQMVLDRLEDLTIASKNGNLIKKLGYANGVNVNKLGSALIKLNDAYNVCGFIRGKDVDNLELYEDLIINAKNPYFIRQFVKNCKNCDVEKMQNAMCEIGRSADLFYFAKESKRVNKQLLAETYLQKRYIIYLYGKLNMFKAFSELDGVDSAMFDEFENSIRQKILTNPNYDGKKYYLVVYYQTYPDVAEPEKCYNVILSDHAHMKEFAYSEEFAYGPDIESITELSLNELDNLVATSRSTDSLFKPIKKQL